MCLTRKIALTIALLVHAIPGHAQRSPILDCELAPLLCPEMVARYLDPPTGISQDTASALGILAARLTRMDVYGAERRAVSEALEIVAEAMKPYDEDLAERILVIANRRVLVGNSEEERTEPLTAPFLRPPVFASPS